MTDQVEYGQVIGWDRGRPRPQRTEGAQVFARC